MASQHVYEQARCPACGRRACLTQVVGYSESREANTRCPFHGAELPDDQMRCGDTCCHGCACVRHGDCDDYARGECPCDCHVILLRLASDVVVDLVAQEEEEALCRCAFCTRFMPATRKYLPGYDGSDGHWVSNRPTHCRHFIKNDISTYYDNTDARNRRLDDYLRPRLF